MNKIFIKLYRLKIINKVIINVYKNYILEPY